MLTFEVPHQPEYSRGELLLRTIFGWIYIAIPHGLLLMLCAFVLWFMSIATFFIILFTGVTPRWYYEWVVQMQRWGLRVGSRLYNLADGYPAFGLNGTDDKTAFDLQFWQISRGELLLRTFFGIFYAGIPHILALYVRYIATAVLLFLAFFVVLFTGKYPENWHKFNVGTIRWGVRLNLFLGWLYRDYPPFAGRPDENLLKNLDHLNS
ncbi:MAG: DUF4389 domain-containing protein [Chitinophagaceae bacterium]|nr:DUF4389 domain-containing protein [Chitinophagaceae bacterium]MBK9568923.1 DUF4389 domain-containing protein [Chitinophagaceae bacterium]MBL0273027.1 DUF4389 domain-containing protein [Chitinophagaceae bacterium]